MKRSPLARRTPLKRTRMKLAVHLFASATGTPQRKSTTKHARRERAFDFMGWVKRQRCTVAVAWQALHTHAGNGTVIKLADLHCDGAIEADHAGNRFTDGDGTRAFDRTCIPLCSKHHRQRTDYRGIFLGFDSRMMRSWCNEAIRLTQGLAKASGVQVPAC